MEQEHADRLYELKACELDQRAMELSQADEDTRRAINVAIKDYNLALVRFVCACVCMCVCVCVCVCVYLAIPHTCRQHTANNLVAFSSGSDAKCGPLISQL